MTVHDLQSAVNELAKSREGCIFLGKFATLIKRNLRYTIAVLSIELCKAPVKLCHWSDTMKKVSTLLFAPAVLLAGQAQAAVDVSGFTIAEASRPYGLIIMSLLLVGIAMVWLRPTS